MDLRRVMFLLVILLVVKVQCVSCPGDAWATPHPYLDKSVTPPEHHKNNSRDNHIVSCEPAESYGAEAVVDFNSAVTFFFFVVPLIRVLSLERNNRTKSDTQFWWFLCCGSSGYIVWVYYFSDCSSFHQSAVFPIYMVSILGAIFHLILLCIATYLTLGVRDKRPFAAVFVPGLSFIAATLMWVFKVKWIGWLGFSLTALSHCFRFGATNYQDKFTFWLFDVSVPIWVVNASISAVGSITGFLWLRHPQLSISMEYKVTSYVIGVLRAIEVYMWCSHGIAMVLSKIEGEINHV